MTPFPAGLEPVEDLSPSIWVQDALKDWPPGRFHVRHLIPPLFEAYARILHRSIPLADGREPTGTWRERAEELGRSLAAETSLSELEGMRSRGDVDDRWSLNEGSLSAEETSTLSSFLAAHTSDPTTCWFAVWSGWGALGGGIRFLRAKGPFAEWMARRREATQARHERETLARLATFDLLGGGRSYLLIAGTVEDAGRITISPHFQSPTLWWPDDRTWFVHTEIDASSTYVGGSGALIARLVGEQVLESFEVDVDNSAAL